MEATYAVMWRVPDDKTYPGCLELGNKARVLEGGMRGSGGSTCSIGHDELQLWAEPRPIGLTVPGKRGNRFRNVSVNVSPGSSPACEEPSTMVAKRESRRRLGHRWVHQLALTCAGRRVSGRKLPRS